MSSQDSPHCARCQRALIAEKPVHLPDGRTYCYACCEAMAADDFEMETGEPFTRWIEKHPSLTMQYKPMEMHVRRMAFFFPFALALAGLAVLVYGVTIMVTTLVMLHTFRWSMHPLGYVVLGLFMLIVFGLLSWRGAKSYLRAQGFKLTLEKGVFSLKYGQRDETFHVDDVTQACVVRPGTVGAEEGALRLKDGRMLTLDTCLSDLHALGVVMDLRFRPDFPPTADDLARVRREKLRKIRGLS